MEPTRPSILTINSGSSTIKFALYEVADPLTRRLLGKVDRIGLPGTALSVTDRAGTRTERLAPGVSGYGPTAAALIEWLGARDEFPGIRGVGHRVVHGLAFTNPERVTRDILEALCRISQYDPDHLPGEIALIEEFLRRWPDLPQVACFDTAFHRTMPRVARLLPIPRRFDAQGVQRYGFHGLSYAYLMEELARVDDRAARGRVILAHLGNGSSLAAVRDGASIDTTMGFTPAGGTPMSTRPGDLDPGVAWYLMTSGGLTPSQFNTLINRESGLLGVSGTSPDMRDLLARQSGDVRAAEAVEMYCYHVRRWIGAFSAVLGGLETLVFSGGIGENSAEVRSRICSGLGFLGVEIDEARNADNAPVISLPKRPVTVRVIRTDEELMIARAVCRTVGLVPPGRPPVA